MNNNSEPEYITIEISDTVKETAKAYLIALQDFTEVWIPKSVCRLIDTNTIEVQEWFAIKNNLDF